MFRKIIAAAATLLVAAGLSVVAVAAPASAHTANYDASCSSLWVNPTSYETRKDNAKPNKVTVTIDGAVVLDQTFGANIGGKKTFPYDGATSHTWSIVIDAVGGTNNTQYDKNLSGVTTPCTYPTKNMQVTCSAVVLDWGSALENGIHFNMEIDGLSGQLNAQIDLNVAGGYKGLGLKVNGFPAVPLTEQQVKSGRFEFTYPDYLGTLKSWSVKWVQVNDMHFNQDGKTAWIGCDSRTPVSVSTEPYAVAPTCEVDGSLVIPTKDRIAFSGGTNNAGPGTYNVTAAVTDGAYRLDGAKEWTIKVLAKGSGLSCEKPPVCIPNSAVSYTYLSDSNSGVIHVANVPGSTGELCQGFWVTATSWKYTTNKVWPQTLDVVQKLDKITTPGDYPYKAAVTCGQGDIYASTVAQPVPTAYLNGPNDPFAEHFLHDMHFTGPRPTWVQQPTNCNDAPVTPPTATYITTCGQYGSVIVPADTAQIDYTVTGSGNQGTYKVTATATAPAVLKDYPKGGWTFNLGTYADCTQACDTSSDGGKSTDLNANGWDFATETRSGGHYEYVETGLRIYTDAADSNGKSAGYKAVNFALEDAGVPSIDYENTSGGSAPGINLSLEVNGKWIGNLVYEPLYPKWWMSKAVAGMPAGPFSYQKSYGTLDDFLFAYAQQGFTGDEVKVVAVGYSLGSGAKGDGIVKSITANCVTYTFGAEKVGPTATYRLGVCYPNGQEPDRFSSKNLYITLSNTESTVPVTFTVVGAKDVGGVDPNADIVRTLQPGEQVEVETTPTWDQGVSYVVKFAADGATIPDGSIEVPKFVGCLDGQPADPSHTDQQCVDGVTTGGSITVALLEGFTYKVTGPNGYEWFPTDVDTATGLGAGTYEVTVTADEGYVLVGPDKWPYEVIIDEPVHCALVDIPVIPTINLECTVAGSFTLPETEGVNWFINGAAAEAGPHPVTEAATYTVTAVLVDSTWGWTGGVAPEPWVLNFPKPAGCNPPTLTGSAASGVCEADAPWITYTVTLTDPDNVSPSNEAHLIITDGTNTETMALGTLVDGTLTGKILWPGSTVGSNGKADGWPGWVDNGNGKLVFDATANFGWTRDVTQATLKVNPELLVSLTYPPATSACANPPFNPPTEPLITPVVTFVDQTCTTVGSYTLGPDLGALWTVDGSSVKPGTYAVNDSRTVNVSAVPDAPGYGFEDGIANPRIWSHIFTTPTAASCGKELTTLALTGVATSGSLMLAGGILFLGAGAVFIARRRKPAAE